MQKKQLNFVVVAQIGAAHGVRGDLKLRSFTEAPADILKYKKLFVKKSDSWQPLTGFNIKKSGNGFLIAFDLCQDRDLAKQYTNLELAIERTELPKTAIDEYYWSDLEGLTVINTQGETLGVVAGLFDAGASDIMIIKGDKERLVPFISQFVMSVDLAAKNITVDWDADF